MPAATGWLVPPDDPDELGRALDLALAMDDARAAASPPARAPSSAASSDLAPMCDRTLAVYRELVGARAGARGLIGTT